MSMMKALDILFSDEAVRAMQEGDTQMNTLDTEIANAELPENDVLETEAASEIAAEAAIEQQFDVHQAFLSQPEVVQESAPVGPAVLLEPPPPVNYFHKGSRFQLLVEGVCTACAHCGQPLTDSDSIQRGIGPICSKKGYDDVVEPKDDTEAFMALAEFPVLVEWLTTKYKPKGNRVLVNALTRVASLNRRTPVHSACTDAIEALGYSRLASALRESICTIELYEVKDNAEVYGFWVKKVDFSWTFWSKLKSLPGVHMTTYPKRQTIVPKSHRRALAKLLVEHYNGLFVKTPKGTHKIDEKWFNG
jgi:hypothetical protein